MKTLIHSLMYIYKIKHDENYAGLWYGSLCQSIRDLNLPPNSAFPFFDWKITIPALVLFITSMFAAPFLGVTNEALTTEVQGSLNQFSL